MKLYLRSIACLHLTTVAAQSISYLDYSNKMPAIDISETWNILGPFQIGTRGECVQLRADGSSDF